ncbi:MAG: HEAT repeat domain-containing protein [Clostridiales bacterium]|nr:HEAT repeat domain-containing protein [Clostridiales bacterium]
MSGEEERIQVADSGGSGEAPDKAGVKIVKEIFLLFSHAVTSLKLFPPHHSTAVKFVDELYAKLREYFAGREELEVDVQENAFLMDGEVVLKEEHLPKSLPYLFHKDGMQKFAILKGIDKHELRELLDVIRETSLLPLEESDVVISIWKKDFSSIRIYAPDEHLLAKIDIFTRQPFDFFVDRHRLFSGQIELSPDDLRDIQAKRMSLGLMEQEEGKDYAELMTALENEEKEMIDFMLTKARQSPPEIEFHDMIFELLSLEERPERIVSVLKFLERHHRELIQEGKFSHAVHLLRQVYELRHLFSEENPGKAAEVDKFLEEVKRGRSIDLVRESIGRKNFDSLSALLDYFGFLGSESVSLATELLDETQEAGTRRAAVDYLEEISQENVDILAHQLRDGKPAITREIISLLGRHPSQRALTCLAALSTYTNEEIRLAAVGTLGSSCEPLAQRILLAFVQDKDEDVGTAAAEQLRWPGKKEVLKRIIKIIQSRQFLLFGPKRRIAILSFLVRSGDPEALEAVRRAMEKPGLFAGKSRFLTKLCAVEALSRVGTPEALEILRQGVKSSNRKVSEACRKALASSGPKGLGPGDQG